MKALFKEAPANEWAVPLKSLATVNPRRRMATTVGTVYNVFRSLIYRDPLTPNVVRSSSPAFYAWRKETLLADKLADVRLQRLCIAALGGTCRIFACKAYPCCSYLVVMSRTESIHRFSFSALFARH